MPAVSVVMPVRNEARFLRAAVESILAQTFTDFELIAVDDASTDETAQILAQLAGRDARLKVIRNERPLGVSASLNRGIQAGRAPLVARMDGDDVSAPDRLERQVAFLDAHPQVVLCGTAISVIDENGVTTGIAHSLRGYAAIRAALHESNRFVHGSTMFRRREAENAGLYSIDEAFAGAEDYELWVRLAARHEVDNLGDVLYAYRAADKPRDGARQQQSSLAVRALAAALLGREATQAEIPPGYTRAPRGRILVLIAAYRDVECQWTIQDLFARARNPDEITVAVCWQYEPRFDAACFHLRTRPEQIRAIHLHVNEARGLGWARHLTERLWHGEEYVLQVDSHMRFAEAWDVRLLEQLAACPSRYPILTVYPWSFLPPRTLHEGPPVRMAALRFREDNLPVFIAAAAGEGTTRPPMHAFWAGGFAFSRADVLREVPQDPHLYFGETEPTHGVRLWTHGWDLFAPTENLVWHLYGVNKRTVRAHWSDHERWHRRASSSSRRARHLLGLDDTDDAGALLDLPRYALGTHRTFADYQAFSGLDFAARSISEKASKGVVNPEFARPRIW